MRSAFTLMETLLVVALIVMLLAIATAAYKRAKWSAKIAAQSVEIRGLMNKAVSEGKFKSQRKLDEEMARLKRQTEIGSKQGQ